MSHDHDTPRVAAGGTDDRALREHGRQLAMDALLEMAFRETADTPVAPASASRYSWRLPAIAAALATSLLLALGWLVLPPSADRQAELAAGWRLAPTGRAAYRVVGPARVRLDAGELFVEAVGTADRPPLVIETPEGTVTAPGAEFYVGTYPSVPTTREEKGTKMVPAPKFSMKPATLTRVLVLAGMATLATGEGSVTGGPRQLLAAEAGQAPVNHAVEANAGFGVDLYRQLAKENAGKNVFFSPYSMSTALTMTAEGARGETAAEMGKVLRFPEAARQVGAENHLLPWNTALIHTGMKDLAGRFDVSVPGIELRSANAAYVEETYPFQQQYLDTVNRFYGTGAAVPVNFRTQPDAARRRINEWVAERTAERIKDVLPEDSVDPDTRLVLLNAIYFKGDWPVAFDKAMTKPADFKVGGDRSVQVPMMYRGEVEGGRFGRFDADGGFVVAELPYKGNDVSMVVVVPNKADGLAAIEERLTTDTLDGWLGALKATPIDVSLPKFRLETAYRMKEPLQALGMVKAFDPQHADFSGMCSQKDLYVSGVFHNAFVEVNEQGTEATAATAVTIQTMSAPRNPQLRADRPFLFAIRDVKSGTILFLGRVADPTAK